MWYLSFIINNNKNGFIDLRKVYKSKPLNCSYKYLVNKMFRSNINILFNSLEKKITLRLLMYKQQKYMYLSKCISTHFETRYLVFKSWINFYNSLKISVASKLRMCTFFKAIDFQSSCTLYVYIYLTES